MSHRAEHDRERGVEGAPESGERIGREVAVIGHAGRDVGMGQLHEQGAPAAEEQHSFGIDATHDRVGWEQACVVRAHCATLASASLREGTPL